MLMFTIFTMMNFGKTPLGKHSTVPATKKKINSIPAKTRTGVLFTHTGYTHIPVFLAVIQATLQKTGCVSTYTMSF